MVIAEKISGLLEADFGTFKITSGRFDDGIRSYQVKLQYSRKSNKTRILNFGHHTPLNTTTPIFGTT
jgi:hypothetical protein